MKRKIVVVDYGIGNVCSVENAITKLGYMVSISSQENVIRAADLLILPGVGAFEPAMDSLRKLGLDIVLAEEVIGKHKPILGICLGMQMMATSSQEGGEHQGLNWIEGRVIKFDRAKEYPVPHVGWNEIVVKQKSPIFERNCERSDFYFDHSYCFECASSNVAATCDYGGEFVAAVQKDNICGVQFHPEKSQTTGLKLFRGFLSQSLGH